MADIAISDATRVTLLQLQRTNALIDRTAQRLSTGLAVGSAVDDPDTFFRAKALTDRAASLLELKDDINLAASTLQSTLDTVDSIDSLLDQMRALALTAKGKSDADAAQIAVQFDVLRTQLDALVNDATFNGKNLLKATPDSLTVVFNETATSSLTVTGIDSTISALGIDPAVTSAGDDYDDFKDDADVDSAVADIDAAITELGVTATLLGASSDLITTRLTFTESLISTLEEGAGNLVDADLNEETANLLALQTRHDLAITAIGLSSPGGTTLTALLLLS